MKAYLDDLFEPVSLGDIQRQPEAFVFKQGSSAPIWMGFHINHSRGHIQLATPARILRPNLSVFMLMALVGGRWRSAYKGRDALKVRSLESFNPTVSG